MKRFARNLHHFSGSLRVNRMPSRTAPIASRHPKPSPAVALSRGSGYAGVTQVQRQPVEFFAFDREYVERLADGETETERHFVDYFSGLLLVKLRQRLRSREDLEDLRQEVFLRVLRSLRRGPGLERPECLGAFVNSVCNNVVFEHLREHAKAGQWDENVPEPRDPGAGIERELVSEERRRQVRTLIDEMSPKDRILMKAVFLEERDKDVVCREQGVGREYLRVMLHRAKKRLRLLLAETQKPRPHGETNLTDLSQQP